MGCSVAVAGGGSWLVVHWKVKNQGSKQQPQGALSSPVWARGSRAGRGGAWRGTRPAGPHRRWPPALRQARGELVAAASPRAELLCRRDGAADRGGERLLGGEAGELAPRLWAMGPETGAVPGGGGWGAAGAPPAAGARAAGKGCSGAGSGRRLAEPARETGAMAGGPLRSWPRERPRAAGLGVGPYLELGRRRLRGAARWAGVGVAGGPEGRAVGAAVVAAPSCVGVLGC